MPCIRTGRLSENPKSTQCFQDNEQSSIASLVKYEEFSFCAVSLVLLVLGRSRRLVAIALHPM
ncbi:predicted protein [Botrytis cinerea T4]|uniref:Uncharacterized protein n=1 Tax=Botryotinia fuckeliana (strain T4) TaxID=999810 RepID=G2Y3V9_BOTF4|nr:predicted protein [Botrytis cinerea T4]